LNTRKSGGAGGSDEEDELGGVASGDQLEGASATGDGGVGPDWIGIAGGVGNVDRPDARCAPGGGRAAGSAGVVASRAPGVVPRSGPPGVVPDMI